jgi:hypothetical protein
MALMRPRPPLRGTPEVERMKTVYCVPSPPFGRGLGVRGILESCLRWIDAKAALHKVNVFYKKLKKHIFFDIINACGQLKH